ncbi:MAG TPA: hypothetical protein VMK12_30575 [Anaeromyxobacteraceae bacterium]|nr:hypothetical protein [Anaeromyxobacteraceae bacterium]
MSRLSLFAVMMIGGVTTSAMADEMGAKKQGKTTFTIHVENVSTPTTLRSASGATAPAPHSPGLWIVHSGKHPVFTAGKPDRGAGLESQAENGDPSKLAASVKEAKGVVASGVFNTPVGDDKPGPALPGKGLSLHLRGQPRR